MPPLVPPHDLTVPLRALVAGLVDEVGEAEVLRRCVALLDGAPREEHLDVLPHLTGSRSRPTRGRTAPS
ncbi:hypothetical protein [Nocardioides alkalitolerans]|uniref:hypothetical protein n=1 Tax=Nocardioides alkalitolerans TaxID=281714 RepID=UPI00041EBCBE|nr:hypothetical protein [Nocardioides alkalitolerans]